MSKYITRRQKKEWVEALRSDRFKQDMESSTTIPTAPTACLEY